MKNKPLEKLLNLLLTSPDEVEKYVEIMQSNSSDNSILRYNVEVFNVFYPELQLIYTKPMIKYNLKEFLSELKKFKFHKVLVLDYKQAIDCKIFHSSAKLIATDSVIDEAFKSMHQGIMTIIKIYASEDWIVLDVIINHSIETFARLHKENK